MNIKKHVLNKDNYLISFVFMNILYFIPMMSKIYQPVGYILMLWSAILVFYSIIVDQKALKNRNVLLLNFFALSLAFSVILNIRYQLVKNLQNYLFVLANFYIIYDTNKDIKNNKKTIITINNVLIGLITVLNVIALIMFVFNISYVLSNGARQGFIEHRLFGIYTSPNVGSMLSFLSVVSIFINNLIKKEFKSKQADLEKKFYVFSGIISIIYIALGVSRGAEISLMVFILVFTFLTLFSILQKKYNSSISIVLSVIAAIICLYSVSGALDLIRSTASSIPNWVIGYKQNVTDPDNSGEGNQIIDVEVGHQIIDVEVGHQIIDVEVGHQIIDVEVGHLILPTDVTSGRSAIWESYLRVFKEKPVFGFGNTNVMDQDKNILVDIDSSILIETDYKWLMQANGYVHNGFIQSLVSAGVVGFILIILFLIINTYNATKLMFVSRNQRSRTAILLRVLYSLIAAIMINEVVETNILFNNRDIVGFYFWWTLGIFYQVASYFHFSSQSNKPKNVAFVAWTPLHLINIMNVKTESHQKDVCYLYIYDDFSNAKIYADKIMDLGYFENVYLVDPNESGSSFSKNLNVLINRNKFNVDIKPCSFDIMFTQGGNRFQKMLYGVHKKKNPYLILNYLEDGMITYVAKSKLELLNISLFRSKLINIINPYSIMNAEFFNGYVYAPKLFTGDQLIPNLIKLRSLNSPGRTTMFELVSVFGLTDSEDRTKYDNQRIYLDQPLLEASNTVDEVIVYNQIKKAIGNDILVKLHPRSTRSEAYGSAIFEEDIPWELLQLRFDFSNAQVYTISSTAPFTSILMFESNISSIKVIFLIDVIINNYSETYPEIFDRISKFAHKFSNEYSNISIPQSLEDIK